MPKRNDFKPLPTFKALVILTCCCAACRGVSLPYFGAVQVGALAPFILQIPSWLLVASGLALVSLFVHVCALLRASYSLRSLIGLAGLSLFLASTTASELASQDDNGVQQLLWCLCTSILTDNYDPNTDAQAWKRVMWMLSTWVQLGLMFTKTSVASSRTKQILLQLVVILKGMKLHFLHGWHCSSWDETKDDSKTQCEHLAAAATWHAKYWSTYLTQIDFKFDSNGMIEVGTRTVVEDKVFWWRSLLEGKPRRVTQEGYTVGRDCCDIAVNFVCVKISAASAVVAVAFSIKRQFKAKLGSMATLSAQYSYLATSELTLALSVIILLGWEWRKERPKEEVSLPAKLCLCVWFLELVYHVVTCRRAFLLAEEIDKQSSPMCKSRKIGLGLLKTLMQTCLVITDLIVGSVAEAAVTGLASIGKGVKVWVWVSSTETMKLLVTLSRYFIAVCIMPMALLSSGAQYLHSWWNSLRQVQSRRTLDEQLLSTIITNLTLLQEWSTEHADEMSRVEGIMYPSTSGTTASTLEAPSVPPSATVTSYSLTALEAVFFSQLLGEAAALILASETNDQAVTLVQVWTWTAKAFRDGMVDSSWLSPNISRAMWHAAAFQQEDDWKTALSEVQQALSGEITPAAQPSSPSTDVHLEKGMASLQTARRAVMHMLSHLDVGPQNRRGVESAMRAGLFAVVAFCKHWGGPETVAVPGPLEHECLMACFIAPAFKSSSSSSTLDAYP